MTRLSTYREVMPFPGTRPDWQSALRLARGAPRKPNDCLDTIPLFGLLRLGHVRSIARGTPLDGDDNILRINHGSDTSELMKR